MKILTYDECQKKIKNLKNINDVNAFAQELMAPVAEAVAHTEPTSQAVAHSHDTPGTRQQGRKMSITDMVSTTIKTEMPSSYLYGVVEKDSDAKIIAMYGKGLTTRDISSYLKSLFGMTVSPMEVSAITDKVFPLVKEWQVRPLASTYPFIYLDGMFFKVRDGGKIVTKCAYIVLGIDAYGHKEVLGIWISETEGAKVWMQILNELKNRGVEEILIACIDGLKGFPEAIAAIFPKAQIQKCIVHQVRNSMKFVPHKDKKEFCEDLKTVYAAPTEEAGFQALEQVQAKWPRYSFYLKSWEQNWADLTPFFGYPQPIRKIMYTTNTIENLNRQFRKVTKTTTVFPHDDALLKLLWLAQADMSEKWIMAVRNWGEIVGQLAILFPDQIRI